MNTEMTYQDGNWCCSEECTVVESYYYPWIKGNKIVNCTGTALTLQQQCKKEDKQSPSCNFYPSDVHKNSLATRSHVDVCKDNRYDLNISYGE